MDKILYDLVTNDPKFSAFSLVTDYEDREKLFTEAVNIAKDSWRTDLPQVDLVMEYYTRLVKLYIAVHPKREFQEFVKDNSNLLD